jgi:hypothetical protein
MWWTDTNFGKKTPRRIVGVVADVDDANVVPGPAPTIYHPLRQLPYAGRLFVHTSGDPYALVAPVTRIIREISADQPVERAATLADVRAEVLAPDRLNAFVFSGFAGIALLIAVVGVAGVLAFSVSARDARVRRAPRHWIGASASAHARPVGRRVDRRRRDRRRRRRQLCDERPGRELHRTHAAAEYVDRAGCRRGAHGRRGHRVADAGPRGRRGSTCCRHSARSNP